MSRKRTTTRRETAQQWVQMCIGFDDQYITESWRGSARAEAERILESVPRTEVGAIALLNAFIRVVALKSVVSARPCQKKRVQS